MLLVQISRGKEAYLDIAVCTAGAQEAAAQAKGAPQKQPITMETNGIPQWIAKPQQPSTAGPSSGSAPNATTAALQPRTESEADGSLDSRTEFTVQQLAQVDYFGFTEELIRRAISDVGPDDAVGVAQWLSESGEKPKVSNPRTAEKIMKLYDDGHQ